MINFLTSQEWQNYLQGRNLWRSGNEKQSILSFHKGKMCVFLKIKIAELKLQIFNYAKC